MASRSRHSEFERLELRLRELETALEVARFALETGVAQSQALEFVLEAQATEPEPDDTIGRRVSVGRH